MNNFDIIEHSRPWINKKDRDAVDRVLKTGNISKGDITNSFENKIAQFIGVDFAISLQSGTAALILALNTLNITEGDEVILPSYVCHNVLNSVSSLGAVGILCDVNEYGVITLETVSKVMSKRVKAIIAVHIYGHPCDISDLSKLGLPIIEDACQSFGMSCNGVMAGKMGDIGVLSFHATKCLTTGEGGMLVTNNKKLASVANSLTNFNVANIPRITGSITDIQAALGLSQLARYSEFYEKRTNLNKKFTFIARELGIKIGTDINSTLPFRFTVRTMSSIEPLIEKFLEKGIIVRRGVDELLHRTMGLDDQKFPNSVELFETNLSIPFYPALEEHEIERVAESLAILC